MPLYYLFHPFYLPDIYTEGRMATIIIVVGIFFQGMYYLYVNVLFYYEKLKLISIISILIFVFNVLTSYILISIYNVNGGAFSFLLYSLSLFLITYIMSKMEINYQRVNE